MKLSIKGFLIFCAVFKVESVFNVTLQSYYCWKAFSESSQTSKMKCFAKTVYGYWPLAIFAKHSITYV